MNKASFIAAQSRLAVTYRAVGDLIPDPRNARTHPKRQIDQLSLELNNYRTKNQELNRQTTDKQEMLRRTVKALRLALSMLEGEEDQGKNPANPQRKIK